MPQEIERKFLVVGDGWRRPEGGTLYRQGYLCAEAGCTVRVRIAGDKAWLTVKGLTKNIRRSEFEYAIPVTDAQDMLGEMACKPIISKMRHIVRENGLLWEIDEFLGENAGLIVAEVELEDEDQAVAPPAWLGPEVSGDPRYYNANLADNPFTHWPAKE